MSSRDSSILSLGASRRNFFHTARRSRAAVTSRDTADPPSFRHTISTRRASSLDEATSSSTLSISMPSYHSRRTCGAGRKIEANRSERNTSRLTYSSTECSGV
nr:MAG: hypothetical protein [Apis mellifera filamentous virus]